jgi:hypothetical protein
MTCRKRCAKALILAPVLLMSAVSLGQTPKRNLGIPQFVSMIRQLSNPMEFDEKPVVVAGFLRLEFEGNELYLHREDYEESLLKNGLWVELDPSVKDEANRLNMHYVTVRGNFFASSLGHMGLTSGTILIQQVRARPPTVARSNGKY